MGMYDDALGSANKKTESAQYDETAGGVASTSSAGAELTPGAVEAAAGAVTTPSAPGAGVSTTTTPAANEAAAAAVSSERRSKVAPLENEKWSVSNWDDILEKMRDRLDNGAQPLTAEEVARMKRNSARAQFIGGLSDLGRAISNMYFTTQYAPNSYDSTHAMSAKAKEYHDRLMKERKEQDEEWMNTALNYGKILEAKADREYEMYKDKRAADIEDEKRERLYASEDATEERAKAEEERKKELHELTMKYTSGQLTAQDYANAVAKVAADNAEENAKVELEGKKLSNKVKEKSLTTGSTSTKGTSGGKSRKGGGSGGRKSGSGASVEVTTTYDKHGNVSKVVEKKKGVGASVSTGNSKYSNTAKINW